MLPPPTSWHLYLSPHHGKCLLGSWYFFKIVTKCGRIWGRSADWADLAAASLLWPAAADDLWMLGTKISPTLSSTHSLFSSHWFPPPSSVHGSGTVQGNLLNLADLVIAVFSELKPYGGGGINMHIECVWGIFTAFTVFRLKWDNKSWRDRLCHVFGRRQHNGTGWQSGYLPAPVLVKLPSE